MVRSVFNWILAVSPIFAGHTPFQGQTPEAIYSRILLDDIVRTPRVFDRLLLIAALLLYSYFVREVSVILLHTLFCVQTFGPDISEEAQDLILQLCTKDPRKRLCCSPGNGVEQLRSHAFFRDFDWTNLFCRRMPSPFRGLVGCVQEDAQYETVAVVSRKVWVLIRVFRRTRDSVVSDTLTEQQQVCLWNVVGGLLLIL
jgi:hypothetical protein